MSEEQLHIISDLLEKHLNGSLESTEQIQLEHWIQSNEENRMLFNRLNDPDQLQAALSQFYQVRANMRTKLEIALPELKQIPVIESIKNNERPSIAHRIYFLKTAWFRYAAAVILVFATTAYFWNSKHSSITLIKHGSTVLTADIAPGRNRAILTLANGQQITLDSTQGNIVKQGNLTVVNLAGKLKYEGMGASADYNTISTPNGGQYQIVLPDGSKIWLNAASSIKFPTAFTASKRNVEVKGEAYMEIAKDAKRTFIVTANGMEIQVLGTSFNVNAYTDEEAVKTTLVEGSIKILKGKDEAILHPGEQVVINHSENSKIQKILMQTSDLEQALAWKNGAFQFNRTPLTDAMRQLSRWYDIEVIYEKKVTDIKLWGEIKRDLTLSQMLDGLGLLGVKFRIEGRKLFIM